MTIFSFFGKKNLVCGANLWSNVKSNLILDTQNISRFIPNDESCISLQVKSSKKRLMLSKL